MPRLSEDLHILLEEARLRPLCIGEMEARLQSRGFALLTMLLAAPFLVPSVPGLSTPFGLAIMGMGLRLACGRKPWLPQSVLRRELPSRVLEKILRGLIRVVGWMERVARVRWAAMYEGAFMRALIGLAIASGGLFLFLPIMVPVMNTLPTVSILLLAAGLMERDGLFILAGYGFGVMAWVYFGAWIWAGKAGFQALHRFF
ncbi:MAG: exopolysaccharide biosynthesis protein [Chthoniobacteraceae bacterium]